MRKCATLHSISRTVQVVEAKHVLGSRFLFLVDDAHLSKKLWVVSMTSGYCGNSDLHVALTSTLALLAHNLPFSPFSFSESKTLAHLQATILKGDADNWQNSAPFRESKHASVCRNFVCYHCEYRGLLSSERPTCIYYGTA